MSTLIKPYQEVEDGLKEFGGHHDLLRKQVGSWCKVVVALDYSLDLDTFVAWRPACELGRHTTLKWMANCFFFENESDAMAFYFTFGQKSETEDED